MTRRFGKWDAFGTSIFSQMTQQANAAGAVNLAQGFPDFDGPEVIRDAAIRALKGHFNQYAPSVGNPDLRLALAARQDASTGLRWDPATEVTVFSGATEALFCAMQGLLEAGDEVIAFEPFFDCYPAGAFSAGAKLVAVPLAPPSWTFDPVALRKAVTPRTRVIIVNTPHNPTGRVFSESELRVIRDLAVEKDLVVVTDEVYEELVFAPAKHLSLAAMPGMRERTVTISSTAKTYSYTGWKVGYAFAPPELSRAIRAPHQFTVFCSATPLQAGMIEAVKLGPDYYEQFRKDYRERRDTLLQVLEGAGFRCTVPEGTYFVMAEYSRIKDVDDVTFASWLTKEIKVAALPVSVFYTDVPKAAKELRWVRFAFCKDLKTLHAAAENLRKLKG